MAEFRPIKLFEAPILTELRKKMWETAYRGIYPDSMIDNYDTELHLIKDTHDLGDKGKRFFFVVQDGEIVGYFCFGAPSYAPYKDYSLCLNALYLLPTARGKGIGRQIMGYVRSMCRDIGESGFYNACNVHNKPALRFYERMGGVLTHTDDGHENPSQDQCYFEHKL